MYSTWVLFYFIFRSHLSVRACRRLASVSMVLGVTKEQRCYLYPSISGWLWGWEWGLSGSLAGKPVGTPEGTTQTLRQQYPFFKTHFAHTALCCWASLPPSLPHVCLPSGHCNHSRLSFATKAQHVRNKETPSLSLTLAHTPCSL